MPVLVQDFLDGFEERARATIHAGNPVSGMIHLLDSAGVAYGTRIDDVPAWNPRSNARGSELAARQAVMREKVRAQKLDIIGAVAVGEVWRTPSLADDQSSGGHAESPLSSPARSEGLLLAVVTPTFGQYGIADIRRDGSIVGVGRGTVDPFVWSPLGPCPLLDTLLATTFPLPWGAKG